MAGPARTYCNPMNLSYRFQVKGWAKDCLREAADPSVAFFQGAYWLFPSKSGGYWRSEDLRDWQFIRTRTLPTEDYAPDVRVIDGQLHCTASRAPARSPIYRSANPAADRWEHVCDCLPYVDPDMFQDDDGRVYLYFGCSNREPIRGVELDRTTLLPIGEPVPLIAGRPGDHGWERDQEDNRADTPPWIEGAWMTKHAGRYYLQYAAPGTQWNVYGDGVYTGDTPLGPFTYARHNPFSLKPGGFITGAGHGSTFTDTYANLWHIATMRISVKHNFERRLGLFPAGIDTDGLLFANTRFGDYPCRLPAGRWNPWQDAFAGWMLLSYRAHAQASSSVNDHPVEHAFNEDIRTYWSARTGGEGEWLRADLGRVCRAHAVQINFAEHDCRQWDLDGDGLYHQYLLEGSLDGSRWFTLVDKRDNATDVPHDYIELAEPTELRHVRLTNRHMPGQGTFAVSGLRVFGHDSGNAPGPAAPVEAARLPGDPLSARVRWTPPAGAYACNVRWGIAPDKLYHSWLVYEQSELELRSLDAGTDYWVAVEPLNGVGVAPARPVPVRA